jgi:hypothetical protein
MGSNPISDITFDQFQSNSLLKAPVSIRYRKAQSLRHFLCVEHLHVWFEFSVADESTCSNLRSWFHFSVWNFRRFTRELPKIRIRHMKLNVPNPLPAKEKKCYATTGEWILKTCGLRLWSFYELTNMLCHLEAFSMWGFFATLCFRKHYKTLQNRTQHREGSPFSM